MTRIGLTADLHGSLPELDEMEKCDVLVIAGDICPDYMGDKSRDQKQLKWLEREFKEWLYTVDADEIIAIGGNHDFVFEKTFLTPNLPWTYLQDEMHTAHGLNFYGTPWVPRLKQWAFYATDGELRARARRIPDNVDVLITHGPPYGYGDRVTYGDHVGEPGLTDELLRINPLLVVTGHIHEDYGHHRGPGGIDVYNVSRNTVRYEPINEVVYVTI